MEELNIFILKIKFGEVLVKIIVFVINVFDIVVRNG